MGGGGDTFLVTTATISVNCKPKLLYSSSATSWYNDMYSNRIRYPEEHEIAGTSRNLSRDVLSSLIFIRDSAKQFLLSSIQEDTDRCTEGGQHLERECK